jgi:glycerate kinase
VATVRVVLATDSFKGTITAADAVRALAAGVLSAAPHAAILERPMADGGEGTLDALAAAHGAVRHPVRVTGPDGRSVDATWLALDNGDTAVVELAETSGITLLRKLAPLDAHTRGLGEAITAALDAGAHRVLVAIGGSASTDGGAGVLTALGARFLDANGHPVPDGARGLSQIAAADLSGLRALPPGGVTVLSDVTNPLTGAGGAAAVYGPQKGATAPMVALMDDALAHYAGTLAAAGADTAPEAPGAGAAGGTGFGLAAWGASLASGAETVATAVGLADALVGADLVVTGEGRYDGQSAAGKVTSEVIRLARAAGVPVALVAGAVEAPTEAFEAAFSLTDLAGGTAQAMADPARWLHLAGEHLAALQRDRR